MQDFKTKFLEKIKLFKNNPLKYKFPIAFVVILFLLFYSIGFVAAANISKFVAKPDSSLNNSQNNTPVKKVTDTPTPSPTVAPTAVYYSPTPTTAATGTIIFKYLKLNTQDLLQNVDTQVTVSGPTSLVSKGTMSLHTITNLVPGKYQVKGNVPSGYSQASQDCSKTCKSFSNDSGCNDELDLSAGETVTIYCGFSGGGSSNQSSNPPTGKPEVTITYPTNGQTITFDSPTQSICIVTIPGANTQGAVFSYNLNGSGWQSGYCFTPPAGPNTVQFKVTNSANIDSDTYSISFTFVKNY